MICPHRPYAVCWLCSDAVPWWRDARYGDDPPNERVRSTPPPVIEPAVLLRKYNRTYYLAHHEDLKEKHRAYYQAHRLDLKEKHRAYYQVHRE